MTKQLKQKTRSQQDRAKQGKGNSARNPKLFTVQLKGKNKELVGNQGWASMCVQRRKEIRQVKKERQT